MYLKKKKTEREVKKEKYKKCFKARYRNKDGTNRENIDRKRDGQIVEIDRKRERK